MRRWRIEKIPNVEVEKYETLRNLDILEDIKWFYKISKELSDRVLGKLIFNDEENTKSVVLKIWEENV